MIFAASSDAEEEVFAEDYDDMTGSTIQPPADIPQPQVQIVQYTVPSSALSSSCQKEI